MSNRRHISKRRRHILRRRFIRRQARNFLKLDIHPLLNPCSFDHLAFCWRSRDHDIFRTAIAIRERERRKAS